MADSYQDSVTGAEVRFLTRPDSDADVIYQTHPMWTPGQAQFVYNAATEGHGRQPHALDMDTGRHARLTKTQAHDWVLARKTPVLYHLHGNDLWRTDVAQAVAEGPEPVQVAKFDGLAKLEPSSLTIDAAEDVLYAGVRIKPDRSWGIAAMNHASGEWRVVIEVNFRVGHVQANPFTPGLVMFCHETGGDSPQRTWMVRADSSGLQPLYRETYDEWVTHEVWWGQERIIFTIWPYDDEHKRQPHGIASAEMGGGELRILSQYPAWHTHGSPDGEWAVGDDFGRRLWLVRVAGRQRRLLTQGHLGEGFKTHPHPSFTPDSKAVVFNSSRRGSSDVCMVTLPDFESLPEPDDAE